MIKSLTLNNFKCFQNQSFTFGKLTLLSGLNGMGKSTVLQSLLLLRQSLEPIAKHITTKQDRTEEPHVLLLNGNLVQLGTWRDVLFEGATDDLISIGMDNDEATNIRDTAVTHKANFVFRYDPYAVVVKNIDQDLNITEETVSLLHASLPEHVTIHEDWIQSRLRRDIQTGTQLWEQRNQHFPAISFCNNVESQMRSLRIPMLRFVMNRLFDIQETCSNWVEGGFDPMHIAGQVSPESQSTMDRYGESRKFRCPDGVERIFDWHVKISHEAWRIYIIWDDAQPGKLTIGYIGKHLPTVNKPT